MRMICVRVEQQVCGHVQQYAIWFLAGVVVLTIILLML